MTDWTGLTPAEAQREYNRLFMAKDMVTIRGLSTEVRMLLTQARMQEARDKRAAELAWKQVVRSESIEHEALPRNVQLMLTVSGAAVHAAGYNADGDLVRCTLA